MMCRRLAVLLFVFTLGLTKPEIGLSQSQRRRGSGEVAEAEELYGRYFHNDAPTRPALRSPLLDDPDVETIPSAGRSPEYFRPLSEFLTEYPIENPEGSDITAGKIHEFYEHHAPPSQYFAGYPIRSPEGSYISAGKSHGIYGSPYRYPLRNSEDSEIFQIDRLPSRRPSYLRRVNMESLSSVLESGSDESSSSSSSHEERRKVEFRERKTAKKQHPHLKWHDYQFSSKKLEEEMLRSRHEADRAKERELLAALLEERERYKEFTDKFGHLIAAIARPESSPDSADYEQQENGDSNIETSIIADSEVEPGTSSISDDPDVRNVPDVFDDSGEPDTPGIFDVSDTPDAPGVHNVVPNASDEFGAPDVFDAPEAPDRPDGPEIYDASDEPEVTSAPDTSVRKFRPQARSLWPLINRDKPRNSTANGALPGLTIPPSGTTNQPNKETAPNGISQPLGSPADVLASDEASKPVQMRLFTANPNLEVDDSGESDFSYDPVMEDDFESSRRELVLRDRPDQIPGSAQDGRIAGLVATRTLPKDSSEQPAAAQPTDVADTAALEQVSLGQRDGILHELRALRQMYETDNFGDFDPSQDPDHYGKAFDDYSANGEENYRLEHSTQQLEIKARPSDTAALLQRDEILHELQSLRRLCEQ